MNRLLKSYSLSEKAIRVYREGLGKLPFTFSEIKKYLSNLSEENIKNIIDELIAKKLVILINPQYSEAISHYIFIPPFAAVINSFTGLDNLSSDEKQGTEQLSSQIAKFQDNLYQDIEHFSEDLINVITEPVNNTQSADLLTEVEQNVKKFIQVILSDIISSVSNLKRKSMIDARDMSHLYKSVKQKLEEAEEIATNMFTQFRDIVSEIPSSSISPQVESFKLFIRKLGESIDKRVHEISSTPQSAPSEKFKLIENSLYNILADYISKNKISLDKFWNVSSYEKINEVISLLLNECKKEIIIIVPKIENFIPLEKIHLDYSVDPSLEKNTQSVASRKKKPKKSSRSSINKKQKKEVEDTLDTISKQVSKLKGFELSHNIAELLGLISEVNPESVIIESIQGWLGRLLVIRKNLDSNTQYLFLEAIDKWKKEYSKVQKKEEEPESKEETDLKKKSTSEEKTSTVKASSNGLKIKIISSEPHDNKHVLAFKKKDNIEYLQLKNNKIIGIVGDNSYLIFGIGQKAPMKTSFEISGFLTNFSPLIDVLHPHISKICLEAKPPKEIQITKGFNEIIENINDYSGKKMAKRLNKLLNVVFEKEGISLNILEIKLMIGKLEKIHYALDDEMKEYIIEELNRLNGEFSTLEVMYAPEFRPPILEGEIKDKAEELIPEEGEIEALDSDKINNLFELFLEKIDGLKGEEIVEQIDKFIDVVLELQGYSAIINWKKNLRNGSETVEGSFKDKIKKDFLHWKWGLLNQTPPLETPLKEESSNYYSSHQQIPGKKKDTISIMDEEYSSPGLVQSQFATEAEPSPIEDSNKEEESGVKMKELFDSIQTNLGEMSGVEISKILQNIMDIILETEGYSMALKGFKDWISKLRMIRKPLESEIKEDFELEFLKWMQKYSGGEEEETTLEFGSSFGISEEESEVVSGSEEGQSDKFDNLMQNAATLKGNELSSELQEIADIILLSHGAVAANPIRQWISKLRSIRDLLEYEIKADFVTDLESWKEKFS